MDLGDIMKDDIDRVISECISICLEKIKRDAGYGGQWDGYGSHMGLKTGEECAEGIRERFMVKQ